METIIYLSPGMVYSATWLQHSTSLKPCFFSKGIMLL